MHLFHSTSLTVLVFTLGSICLQASTVSAKDTVTGIRLITADSSEFTSLIRMHLDDASLKQLSPVIPYLIVVKNESSKSINELRVLFTVHTDRRTIRRVNQSENLSFAPGTTRIESASPLGGLIHAIAARRVSQYLAGGGVQQMDAANALFSGHSVDVTLDSVTYADGQFVGPDTLGFYPKLLARDRTRAAFNAIILSMRNSSDQELREWLAGQVASATKDAPVGHGLDDINFARNYLQSQPALLIQVLDQGRRSDLFSIIEAEQQKIVAKPELHR